ncbi:hypothetical protein F66182_4771 [Fusarium sp. NRRL 66182]|nr:hypothetical protein F66182_4771 [Fusarium sp. NRRL 66182]
MVTLSEKYSVQEKSAIQDAGEIASNNPFRLSAQDRDSLMLAVRHIRDHISDRRLGLTGTEVQVLLFYISHIAAENRPGQLVSFAHPITRNRAENAITEGDMSLIGNANKAIMDLNKELEHCSVQEKDIVAAYNRLRSDGLSETTSLSPTAANRPATPSVLSRASQISALQNFKSLDFLNGCAASDFDPVDLGADAAQKLARFMKNNPLHFPDPTKRASDKIPGITKDPILPGYSNVRQAQLPKTVADIDAEINKRVVDHEYLLLQLIHNNGLL